MIKICANLNSEHTKDRLEGVNIFNLLNIRMLKLV